MCCFQLKNAHIYITFFCQLKINLMLLNAQFNYLHGRLHIIIYYLQENLKLTLTFNLLPRNNSNKTVYFFVAIECRKNAT